MSENKKFNVYDIVSVGFMAALVFVANFGRITIPLGVDNTAIHIGNVFCLLAGLALGGVRGGLAAGVGSFLYDLTNPLYIAGSPFTFAFKFIMAFTCGVIAYSANRNGDKTSANFLGASAGAVSYIILYLVKGFITNVYFNDTELATAFVIMGQKAIVSTINGALAVVVSVPLAAAIKKALRNTAVYKKLGR